MRNKDTLYRKRQGSRLIILIFSDRSIWLSDHFTELNDSLQRLSLASECVPEGERPSALPSLLNAPESTTGQMVPSALFRLRPANFLSIVYVRAPLLDIRREATRPDLLSSHLSKHRKAAAGNNLWGYSSVGTASRSQGLFTQK